MELKVLESPGKEWDEFASRYTSLIFYQSLWSEILKKGLGGQPLYFYLKDGERWVAGLPGVLLNFKFFKVYYASIPYGNMIGETNFFPSLMEFFLREVRKRRIDQVRISDCPFLESRPPQDFKPVQAKVTLLDLQGTTREKIWEGYKKYIRRDIRKAEKSGVTLRRATSREDIDLFYHLYLASMERNRAAPKYPLRWFQALCGEGVNKERNERRNSPATVLLAVYNQVAIAGAVLVHSLDATHYFHNGSRREFLTYCPNELLIHRSIEEAVERGSTYFDFMGSDPQDQDLIHFKEKWGARSLDVCTYVRDYHPLKGKLWEWGKRMASSRWGSMMARGLARWLRE